MEKMPMVATKEVIEQLFDDAATSYNRTGPSIFTQFGARLAEQMPLTPGALEHHTTVSRQDLASNIIRVV
jgi:hypothetical protein